MKLSKQNSDPETIEMGECDLGRALATLQECCAASRVKYEHGEDALAATGFAVYRSDEDFLEISCTCENKVLLMSDRIVYPSWWARASVKNHFERECSDAEAKAMLEYYFGHGRDAFENQYQEFLTG